MTASSIPMPKTRIKRKRWKRIVHRLVLFLLLLIVLAVAGLIIWSNLRTQLTVTYDTYTASIGSISNAMSFSGSFALVDSATYTAEADTTVRTVYVAEGERVQKGDRLMRLSNGQTVEAGFDGTVNELSVEPDDSVAAGDSLVQLADFDHLTVSIRVDEYDISNVSVGQECTVTVTALETSYPSVIEHINYISASSGSVAYYTATANVEVSEGVYPGMQVTVTIPQEEASDVVVLRMDALSFDQNNSAFVYQMDENGELYAQYVEVGINNGNYVQIVSGLEAGDTVYVEAQTEETTANSLMSLFGISPRNEFNGGNRGGGGGFQGFDGSFDPGTLPSGGGSMGGFPGGQ